MKKKVLKKKNVDVKQNKQIKLLKEKLKKLATKFLLKQRKKLPKNKYEKIKNIMIKKVSNTKNKKMLEKLINSLLKSPIKNLPETITRNIPSTNVIRETIRDIPRNIINENLRGTKEKYNKMKDKYTFKVNKYENGTINGEDLFEMYILTSDFGRDINSRLPSRAEIASAYQTVKSRLNYFRNYINNNLLNQSDMLDNLPSRQAPAPPPDPPAPEEPEPEPSGPSPDPPPPPPSNQGPPPIPIDPLTNPINLQSSYVGDNLPLLGVSGLIAGAFASTAAYNLFKRNYRSNSEIPALRTDTRIDRELARIPVDQSIVQFTPPRQSAIESNRLMRLNRLINILEDGDSSQINEIEDSDSVSSMDAQIDENESVIIPALDSNQIPVYYENRDPLLN